MLEVGQKIKIFAGTKSWIEGSAVRQLEQIATREDVIRIVGMPDLHPSQGVAVGAAFITQDRIFPDLVGSDIGCGMAFWRTSVKPGKADKAAKKLKGLEHGIDDPIGFLEGVGVEPCGYEHSLGTIGHGNHFAELLAFDEIREPERVEMIAHGAKTVLLVHSGSRDFGRQILHAHTAAHQDKGIPLSDLGLACDYMSKHNHALEWAKANRKAIATRILDMLGANGEMVFDIAHNFVEPVHTSENLFCWVHRKGAIPSDRGPVVIPGSRGAHSYLVEPIGDHEETGWSLSHGAGRKMSRKDARIKFDQGSKFGSVEKLSRTKFGSVVICEDRQLLMEEFQDAYKSIDQVIQDLVDHGLIKVLALMKPILTYKVRRTST